MRMAGVYERSNCSSGNLPARSASIGDIRGQKDLLHEDLTGQLIGADYPRHAAGNPNVVVL